MLFSLGVVFFLLRSHWVYSTLITLILFSRSRRFALHRYVAKRLPGSQTERALLPSLDKTPCVGLLPIAFISSIQRSVASQVNL